MKWSRQCNLDSKAFRLRLHFFDSGSWSNAALLILNSLKMVLRLIVPKPNERRVEIQSRKLCLAMISLPNTPTLDDPKTSQSRKGRSLVDFLHSIHKEMAVVDIPKLTKLIEAWYAWKSVLF